VVDDTPDNLALMSSLLKDDYKVRKCQRWREGQLKIAGSDLATGPDPARHHDARHDGYEVCQRLKRDPKTMSIR